MVNKKTSYLESSYECESSAEDSELYSESDDDMDSSYTNPDSSADETGSAVSDEDIDRQLKASLVTTETAKYVWLGNTPTCLKYSENHNILVVGTINGDVEVFYYEDLNYHKSGIYECFLGSSCADVDFSRDGNSMYTMSPTKGFNLIDLNSDQLINYGEIRECNHLTVLKTVNETVFSTGDDRGLIKYWDIRAMKPTCLYKCCSVGNDNTNDYVSSIIIKESNNLLASTSGAGVLTIFDLRNLQIISQFQHSEGEDLLTMTCMKNDEIIVAGSLGGKFVFVPWEESNISPHTYNASSVNCCNQVLPLSNSIIISAWDDCLLRVHSVFPHKQLGILGKQPFPPDHAAIAPDKSVILSCGFDKRIKIWDIKNIEKKLNKILKKRKDSIIIERCDSFFNML